MASLSVGSRVMVKLNLIIEETYSMNNSSGGYEVVREMLKYRGKIVTIAESYKDGYKIEEDNGYWWWTDEMFISKDNSVTLTLIQENRKREKVLNKLLNTFGKI